MGIYNTFTSNKENTDENKNTLTTFYVPMVLSILLFLFQYLYTRQVTILLFMGIYLIIYILSSLECPKISSLLCVVAGIYFICYPQFYNIVILYSALEFFIEKNKKYRYPFILFVLFIMQFFCANADQMVYRLLEAVCAICVLVLLFCLQSVVQYFHQKNKKMQEVLKHAALNQLREENLRKELAITNQVLEKNTRMEERERISRDIHNVAGHTITAGLMALEAAQAVYEKEEKKNDMVYDKMEIAHQRVKEGLGEIRKAVRLLEQEDDMTLDDCVDSIRILLERFEMDTGVRIRHNLHTVEQDIRIDMKLATFLRGSITELITNGVKHGGAGRFIVSYRNDANNISWTVIDNGTITARKTFREYVENGFGLKKIYDEVQQYGGDFTIDDTDGFTVKFSLPLANIERMEA